MKKDYVKSVYKKYGFPDNTERHAFITGIFEAIAGVHPNIPYDRDVSEFDVQKEYHYYIGGIAVGAVLVALGGIFAKWLEKKVSKEDW